MEQPDLTFEQIAEAAEKEQTAPEPEKVEEAAPAPAPEAAAAEPEAKAEPATKEEAHKPPETVPLAVHIRQRQRHDAEMAQMRQTVEIGNQRLQELLKALKPEEAPIDRTADPLGAALQQMDGLQKELGETKGMLNKREQQEAMRSQIANFQRAVAEDEQVYSETVPDIKEAIQYAKDLKFREYTALGLEPHQAAARVQQDAFALAQHAFATGSSPSDMVYRMAQALGYKKAAAAAAAAAPAQSQAEKTIEMRAAGAAKDKASGGASATEGGISFAQLAAMDNDEFAKLTSGKNWAKLNGG